MYGFTDAVRKLENETGFSAVEIAAVRDLMEIDQEVIDVILRDMARTGEVVLALGDWSCSDEHTRSGAITYKATAENYQAYDRHMLLVSIKK